MSESTAWKDAFSNIARFASVSAMKEAPEEGKVASRLLRYILQSAARELLPNERVAKCLRVAIPPKNKEPGELARSARVDIWKTEKLQRAFYGNLAQCASVWHDPVCASKITERRRVEMAGVLAGCKYYQLMVTRTFQHNREDHLADLQKDFSEAKRRMKSGWGWAELEKQFGLIGSITGTEANYGLEYGFHLHDHGLYFFREGVDPDEFREAYLKRYTNAMAENGRYTSAIYGLDVRTTNDSVGDYVNKWGVESELAKYPVKRGREGHYSAFQVLQLYTEDISWARPVFLEYAMAMKGKKQLVYSRGLRDDLEAGREVSDEELVEKPEEEAKLFASLSLLQWRIILAREKRGELLEVASKGTHAELAVYLRCLGIFLELLTRKEVIAMAAKRGTGKGGKSVWNHSKAVSLPKSKGTKLPHGKAIKLGK